MVLFRVAFDASGDSEANEKTQKQILNAQLEQDVYTHAIRREDVYKIPDKHIVCKQVWSNQQASRSFSSLD